MYKVFYLTFGCKVNQYETECLKAVFSEKGFAAVTMPSEADVIVVNSCTVTSSGDSKSLYAVRKLRRERPEAVIVLTGCLPQTSEKLRDELTEADIITGTRDRCSIPDLVLDFIENRSRTVFVREYGRNDSFETMPCGSISGKTRAFVKIQDGCDRFCSYCIIPYSRGRCRSKPIESLRTEIASLAEAGHREIVLVGINLAFYGREFGLRLADAVELCCGIDGVERVRLGSLEPEEITDSDLERLAAQSKFCPQFHLSLQSGCNRTLKAMNRRYTAEEYMELVKKIRLRFPDCAFTTDMMTGFPTEKDEDFEESIRFAEAVGFAKIHVFQYSPREGTPAARMPQLPKKVKSERADRLKALSAQLHEEYLKSRVGATVPVLFEQENSPDFHQGYAPDYTLIKIARKNSKKSLRNSIFYVKIEEYRSDYCIGSIVPENSPY